jgi:hypothetical protein
MSLDKLSFLPVAVGHVKQKQGSQLEPTKETPDATGTDEGGSRCIWIQRK